MTTILKLMLLMPAISSFASSSCPAVPAEQMFPCFCFQDTSDLICRGGEGRHIDDETLIKIMDIIRASSNTTMGKITLSQTEISNITDKTFAGIQFAEVVIRFNDKLRFVHEEAFSSMKDFTRNFSFGEISSPYESQSMPPIDLSFLKGFTRLSNLFISGINIGFLDRHVFLAYVKQSDPSHPRIRFYFLSLLLDCGCQNRWLFGNEVTSSERRHLLAGSLSPHVPLLTCRSERTSGLMIPLRSLSLADFKHCESSL